MTNRTTWLTRAGSVAALVVLAGALGAVTADAKPAPGKPRRSFNLFAETFALFNVNRVACGVINRGAICYDPGGSPIGGGGFWPKGTPDAYIYGSGLQAAGIIAADAGFAWAGDTVGAQFYDPSTGPLHGAGLTPVFNSITPADLATWPNGATVRDTSLYSPAVIGQPTASQQDLWWRSWDGDPNLATGRKHPLGIMVETRALGWNYPAGNQDIQYLLFTFYNVSASDPARYNGLDPAIRTEIADIGKLYSDGIKSRLNVTIPAAGYRIDSLFVAFASDTDVGPAAIDNYSTAILPFNLGLAYINDFSEAAFTYPSDIFAPPFAVGPGFVGAKYLKSPINPATSQQVGLTMFSNTLNPNTCVSGLCDAQNVVQLWRYLSGNINPAAGDNPCTVQNPRQDKVCFLSQTAADTRFFQASGPFSLDAGQSATIVVAYMFAPAVASALIGRVGTDNPPGIPSTGAQIFSNPGANIRFIERAAGWVSEADGAAGSVPSVIEQTEVTTTQASLLAKSMVAQRLFDNKFLLPSSPTAPPFYLVPGENKVTIIWQPSTTETVGDPYFTVASATSSGSLYDPNYRRFDVEGYRIYRGRTQGNLELIAQFDYSNTTFPDRSGSFDYGSACAPELGLRNTPGCPVAFDTVTFTVANPVDLVGDVVQVPRPPVAAGRVRLQNGSVLLVVGDTAVTGGGSGYPSLDDTGVPFAMVDTTVRNSFTYFYAVTAYDVNSLKSGPSSLESARITKSATPRAPAANQVAADLAVELWGRTALDQTAAQPTIDATNGTFSGKAPPTTGVRSLGAQLFADIAMEQGSAVSFTIDSIVPGYYHVASYFISVADLTGTRKIRLGPDGPLGPEDGIANLGSLSGVLPADSALLASRGLDNLPFSGQVSVDFRINPVVFFSKDADWHPAVDGSFWGTVTGVTNAGGSRWFSGNSETAANPTVGNGHGTLTGVTTIYRPHRANSMDALMRRVDQTTYHVFRAADIKIYWGAAAGTVDSVIDVTHNVTVSFSPQNRASYGFRRDTNGDGVNSNDFMVGACLPQTSATHTVPQAGCAAAPRTYSTSAALETVDVTGDGVVDGNGFGLYINGESFIFQTAALPSSTVWTYRSYVGHVTQNGGQYAFSPAASDPAVPGLSFRFTANAPATFPSTAEVDLAKVHTVPDPYYVTNNLETTTNRKILKFVNLPSQAILRIYTVSGVLVNVITHNDPAGGGEETWNLRNRNNQFVASGVYFYHVETPSGQERIGRFTVVNFAQ